MPLPLRPMHVELVFFSPPFLKRRTFSVRSDSPSAPEDAFPLSLFYERRSHDQRCEAFEGQVKVKKVGTVLNYTVSFQSPSPILYASVESMRR